jgi:hypothetical protein
MNPTYAGELQSSAGGYAYFSPSVMDPTYARLAAILCWGLCLFLTFS